MEIRLIGVLQAVSTQGSRGRVSAGSGMALAQVAGVHLHLSDGRCQQLTPLSVLRI